jgi:hypothetical protein
MSRISIKREGKRLILTLSPPPARMAFGFLLLFFTLACLTPLGILGIMQAAVNEQGSSQSPTLGFTDPHANHFGFLWLVGVGLVAVALPIFAWKLYRANITYSFDRVSGKLTRNGKVIAPLRRIESVRLWQHEDCDDRMLYRLSIIHSDGFEHDIDESYDEAEMWSVAREVADFTHTDLKRNAWRDEDVPNVLRDLWRQM